MARQPFRRQAAGGIVIIGGMRAVDGGQGIGVVQANQQRSAVVAVAGQGRASEAVILLDAAITSIVAAAALLVLAIGEGGRVAIRVIDP
jgi:hypothetical protein